MHTGCLQSALHLFYFTLLLPIYFDFHLKWAVPMLRQPLVLRLARTRSHACLTAKGVSCDQAIVGSLSPMFRSRQQSRAATLVLLAGVFVDCGEFPTTGVLSLSTLRQRRQQRKKERMSRRPRCCCCSFFFIFCCSCCTFLLVHMYVCVCVYVYICTPCTRIEL